MFYYINRYYSYESHVKDQITLRDRQTAIITNNFNVQNKFQGYEFIICNRQLPVGRWEFLQVLEFD